MNIVGHNPAPLNQTQRGFNQKNEQQELNKQSFLYQIDQAVKNGQDNLNGSINAGQNRRGGLEQSGLQQLQSGSSNRLKLQKSFLDGSKVNNKVAKDLMNAQPKFSIQQIQNQQNDVSRAGQDQQQQQQLFNHRQTLLDNKALKSLSQSFQKEQNAGDDETRSMKSEFDYTSKRKFVEMVKPGRGTLRLGTNVDGKIMEKDMDRMSNYSRRTGYSMRSNGIKKPNGRLNRTIDAMQNDAIEEQMNEDGLDDLEEIGGNDGSNMKDSCNQCNSALTSEEFTLNQRFLEQAQANGLDTSVFPLCLKCHFDQIVKRGNQSGADMTNHHNLLRQAQVQNNQSPGKNPYFIDKTAKKQFYPHIHQVSDEFKDLGTLHYERRNVDYFPQDDFTGKKKLDLSTPQAQASRKWKQNLGEKLASKYNEDDNIIKMQRIEKAREREQLKAFVGMKLQNENQKLLEMSKQLSGVVPTRAQSNNNRGVYKIGSGFSQAGQSIAASNASKFPSTTSREAYNEEIYDKTKILDRTNFKRSNVFGAYVNAMFNGGVFVNPAQDQC
ncbi:UNKNOWN [Stylonychia lemnae]|uniref:Uncharacterized protein n=1 Tax=Stylonychia lemnae TaxID=5949 RepID=A0A077ZUY4_STYLE|nr:UNKNOWN [Stylonychia lemnae]|eukprot:CDW73389.1 UNKNOWN [Stylonychia lemnae]